MIIAMINCKSSTCFFQIFFACTTFWSLTLPVNAVNVNPVEQFSSLKQDSFNNLQNFSENTFIDWDTKNDIPKYIRTDGLDMQWKSSEFTDRSLQFFSEHKNLYGMTDPTFELHFKKQFTDEIGMTHVELQQFFKNVPVYGSNPLVSG